MSHTPTPWHWIAQASTADRFELICLKRDEPGFVGSIIAKDMTHEDAKFAMTAANAFEAMREALREVEWSDTGSRCPQCANSYRNGHKPKCILGNALELAEEE
jgi:hypothetical protein